MLLEAAEAEEIKRSETERKRREALERALEEEEIIADRAVQAAWQAIEEEEKQKIRLDEHEQVQALLAAEEWERLAEGPDATHLPLSDDASLNVRKDIPERLTSEPQHEEIHVGSVPVCSCKGKHVAHTRGPGCKHGPGERGG